MIDAVLLIGTVVAMVLLVHTADHVLVILALVPIRVAMVLQAPQQETRTSVVVSVVDQTNAVAV